jgi:hypothetical protein
MAASRCWRRASSWARAFCFLLILLVDGLRLLLLPRISDEFFPLLRRRKLKLERRGPTCGSPVDWDCAIEGRTEGSGEPSYCTDVLRGLGAVLAIVGGCEALIMNGWHLARVILAMKGAAQTTLLLGVPKKSEIGGCLPLVLQSALALLKQRALRAKIQGLLSRFTNLKARS